MIFVVSMKELLALYNRWSQTDDDERISIEEVNNAQNLVTKFQSKLNSKNIEQSY